MSEQKESADRKAHWEKVYSTKASDDVSWFQPEPTRSMALINSAGINKDQAIIDVGGGASRLVDHLLQAGYQQITVLDIAQAALVVTQQRLGDSATAVEWLTADATAFKLNHPVQLWHDRAVFHFLTQARDRDAYICNLKKTLSPEGTLILAAFSLEGPKKCSDLDIVQYDAKRITIELGPLFKLKHVEQEAHTTPSGAVQQFNYFVFSYHP
ncbi:MAG: class I SAM-dependent methyltransferase [Sedimenticola thiotaurini]|uniref:Class I SAM-dependent methyltransferase n=1 Tax=Sedimenticola thiotaurini TaxID=1543721 RepID=A0A558CUL7_9GAMM|nr:MAG: class I SAM-dependent methyltransferase [Sedimenticola thiotaurini]